MSFVRCLPGLVESGEMSQEQADQAREIFGKRKKVHLRSMGDAAADAAAAKETAEALKRDAARKARLNVLKIKAQRDRLVDVMGEDGIDPKKISKVIERVDLRRRAVEHEAHATIEGILYDHGRSLTGGLRNKAQMTNVVRELFGHDTGDQAAKELADAWRKASEMLRKRFNSAGGNIGKIEDWGLPQSHDALLVGKDFKAWHDFVMPRLDRKRMIDESTGQPFDDETLSKVLRDVWDSIRTDGWSDRTPGGVGASSTANRRAEHRFLHFKDADAWLEYQQKFGRGTPFDAMMGHIRGMAKDIAPMELLGPNPDATIQWLNDGLDKQARFKNFEPEKAIEQAMKSRHRTDQLWEEYKGTLQRPVSRRLSLIGGTYRNIASAAKLGSSPISALGDVATSATTRAFNGLPLHSLLGDYIKLLNPASAADRRMAVRLGLGAQGWSNIVATNMRHGLGEAGHHATKRMSDTVFRSVGLEAITNAGKWANGLAWLGHITESRGKAFGELEPRFRQALERYGIDEAGWDKIRSTPTVMDGGVDWIKPGNIADKDLADKLHEMIENEGDYAVPSPDLQTRATMHSIAGQAGTLRGEFMRSGPLLFKSFGIATAAKHLGRMMDMPTLKGKIGYLAALAIPMTAMGMLTTQLNEIAKGRTPKPFDRKLIGTGIVRGGGFGMFGDVLGMAASDRDTSFGEYLGGPLVSDAWQGLTIPLRDLLMPLVDNSPEAARAQRRAPWMLAKTVLGEVPGSSAWYARVAFDRMVADRVQDLLDPKVEESRRAMRQRAHKMGQDYWFKPGETRPSSSPFAGAQQ